jgi:8-hydroxy-5-deazaflavin:NADPH oxidoreductase
MASHAAMTGLGPVGAPSSIGVLGGTGALGRGLALRWAMAGLDVRLGSREQARAEETAGQVRHRLQDRPGIGEVTGATNRAVAASEQALVLAVPIAGLDGILADLEDLLAGRVLICAVNPLGFDDAGPFHAPVGTRSVAESVAEAAPGASVVAAFHTVSSRELAAVGRPMDDDVPVVGDDPAGCELVAHLANRIEGCRGVLAGPLRLAVGLEALTAVLIGINRQASAHVGVRFSRLPPAPGPPPDG